MIDRDSQLMAVLQIGRATSRRGDGISITDALTRVRYTGLRVTFTASDLLPLINAHPNLIEVWLSYSEDKRTLAGWYVLKTREIGQLSNPLSRRTYTSIQEAVAEFVVRELDYWNDPDEFPPGWSKTLADLHAESQKSGKPVGPPETEWARTYERSRLRLWARFPHDGEIYEALQDTPVSFLTHWRAPFTGGGSGTLPRGTRVRVRVVDWIREPISVGAAPLDSAIENLLVPKADLTAEKYDGFHLTIPTADLNKLFRLVKD